MEQAEDLRLAKLRCAPFHAAQGVDPAGTAPCWDAVVVVGIPAPWPRDISGAEPFASLTGEPAPTIAGADGRRWRPQGVLVEDVEHGVPVMAFERPAAGAGPFARREWLLPGQDPASLVALCSALLAADSDALAGFDPWRADPPEGTVDLLLCTHGSRDVCCGSSGTQLHEELLGILGAPQTSAAGGGLLRLWRTSHAGGHRFAPTAITMPEGVSWAHLGASQAMSVLRRTGDAAALGRHWRGAVSVDEGPAQVADREAFVAHGWAWLDAERIAVAVGGEVGSDAVTIDVLGRLADGGEAGVRASVVLDGRLPMPSCGVTEEVEARTEPVWAVTASEVIGGPHRPPADPQ